MRACQLIAAVVTLALPSSAAAQPALDALLERLRSASASTSADCDAQLVRAARLNAIDLIYGAAVCSAAKRPVEGNFLLSAGQVRSLADLGLMAPAAKADSDQAAALYALIFFHAGGPGEVAVFQDTASRDRFFSLFDAWSPDYGADYNPGWNVRRRPEAASYRAGLAESKAHRRAQLVEVTRLYADAAYVALDRQFNDLQRRNPGGFVEGTPDATLAHELTRRMEERAAALGGRPAGPPPETLQAADVENRFPPASPAKDEAVVSLRSDETVQRCTDLAERMAIAFEARILRTLVTRSPEWGVVWRADIGGGERPTDRLTCTSNSSSSRPLELGDQTVPPLPDVRP